MQPSTPPRAAGHTPSSADLPYGPLPVRSRRTTSGPPGSTPLDQLVDLSWLEPEAQPADAEVVEDSEPVAGADAASDTALTKSLTNPTPEADDDVHFGVAARALGVSRKTVERMVKRGQLTRGPSDAPATVSKRSLVAALEERRRDVTHLTRATEIEQTGSGPGLAQPGLVGGPGVSVARGAASRPGAIARRVRCRANSGRCPRGPARHHRGPRRASAQARRAAVRARHERLVGS